ncbi:MAG: YggT family protein [Maricaulaceae bacterium]|jgi:YggT family protein
MQYELCWLTNTVIGLFQLIVFVSVVLSWLINFNVINPRNQLVSVIWRGTTGITEPALRPIRRMLPLLGGMDLSPIVLLIGLEFIKRILCRILLGTLF